MALPPELLLQYHAHQRREQQSIPTRRNEDVLIGDRRRLGAAGIDHDKAPPTLLQCLHPAPESRCRHETSVRHDRVRTQHQQEVGAIDVRDWNRKRVPEQEEARSMLGVLVDRARREAAARIERLEQERDVADSAEVVGSRISEIDPDGGVAIPQLDAGQVLGDIVERLGPRNFLPAARRAPNRPPQTVRILLNLLQRDGLRTDVSAAERILFIGSDSNDPIGLHLDEQATGRFAQIAGPGDRLGPRHRRAQYWSSRPEKPRTLLECMRSMPSSGTS